MSTDVVVVVFMSHIRLGVLLSIYSSAGSAFHSFDFLTRIGSEVPATSFPLFISNLADISRKRDIREKESRQFIDNRKNDIFFVAAVMARGASNQTHLRNDTPIITLDSVVDASTNIGKSTFPTIPTLSRIAQDGMSFKNNIDVTSSSTTGDFKIIQRHLFKHGNTQKHDVAGQTHHHHHQGHHHRPPHTIIFHAFEIFLCIFLSCFIMLVVVGNAYVILAVCVFEKMRTLSNGLIASLATADFMVALAVMPISLHRELTKGLWTLGWAICDFWVTADVLCCTASILNIAVIAMDRYWLITRNVKYTHSDRCPRRRICVLMLISAWLSALLISSAPLLGWRNGDEKNDPSQCVISQDYVYTLFSTVGAFWLPLGVILVVYSRVFTFARQRVVRRRQKHQGEKSHKCNKNTNGTCSDPRSLLTKHNSGITAVAMAISRKLSVPVNYARKHSKTETNTFPREETRKFSSQVENYTATTPFLIDQEIGVEEVIKEAIPAKGKRSFFSVTLAASRLLRLHRKRQEQKRERRNYAEASSSFSRDDDDFSDYRSKAETSQDMTSDCYSRNGSVFIEADVYDESTGDVLGLARNYEQHSFGDSEQAEENCPDGKIQNVCIVPSKRLLLTPTACEKHQLSRPRSKKRSKKLKNISKFQVNTSDSHQVCSVDSKVQFSEVTEFQSFSALKSKRASSLTVGNTTNQSLTNHEKLRCVNSHPLVRPPSILKNQLKPKMNSLRIRDSQRAVVKCSSIPLFYAHQDRSKHNLEINQKVINSIDLRSLSESFPCSLNKIKSYLPHSDISKLKFPITSLGNRRKQLPQEANEISISVVPPSSTKNVDEVSRDETNLNLLKAESPESSDGLHGEDIKVRISCESYPLSSATLETDSTSPGVESSAQQSLSQKRDITERNFRRKFSQRAAAVITSTTSDLIKIRQSRRMRKSARTLGLIIGGFLICWLPFFCLATITPFCPEVCQVPHIVSSLTLWLGYFNSLLNPIIYAIWDDNFRRAFKRLSRCDLR